MAVTRPVEPDVKSFDDLGTGEPAMAKGISLHLGLNSVDPDHYGGWSGPLLACESDAKDMEKIASSQGFASSTLLTAAATRTAVLDAIASAAKSLDSGDIFLLTNSSHGGHLPDRNGDEPGDGLDETVCLYDGELLDDEIYRAFGSFSSGVRILFISDSCNSVSDRKRS